MTLLRWAASIGLSQLAIAIVIVISGYCEALFRLIHTVSKLEAQACVWDHTVSPANRMLSPRGTEMGHNWAMFLRDGRLCQPRLLRESNADPLVWEGVTLATLPHRRHQLPVSGSCLWLSDWFPVTERKWTCTSQRRDGHAWFHNCWLYCTATTFAADAESGELQCSMGWQGCA